MTESRYVLATNATDAESTRLALVEEIYDPGTIRRLEALDIRAGSRCLEVGAGGGSIARWLAERIGPSGHVVAADIDCRFLHDLPPNVEVRQLDIMTGEVETEHYDVVHGRAVLTHVPDPPTALGRMAAALRPGGVLLTEEADFAPLAFHGHHDADWATTVSRRVFAGLASAKAVNAYLGRDLAHRLGEVGLEVHGGEMAGELSRGDGRWSRMWALTMEAMAPGLVDSGSLTADDATRLLEVCRAAQTVLTGFLAVSVWARRPG